MLSHVIDVLAGGGDRWASDLTIFNDFRVGPLFIAEPVPFMP